MNRFGLVSILFLLSLTGCAAFDDFMSNRDRDKEYLAVIANEETARYLLVITRDIDYGNGHFIDMSGDLAVAVENILQKLEQSPEKPGKAPGWLDTPKYPTDYLRIFLITGKDPNRIGFSLDAMFHNRERANYFISAEMKEPLNCTGLDDASCRRKVISYLTPIMEDDIKKFIATRDGYRAKK